jgi:hypothetical protein
LSQWYYYYYYYYYHHHHHHHRRRHHWQANGLTVMCSRGLWYFRFLLPESCSSLPTKRCVSCFESESMAIVMGLLFIYSSYVPSALKGTVMMAI